MKTISKILIAIGVLLVCAALAILAYVYVLNTQARPAADPEGTFETTQDTDGFPAVDWAYWQSVNPDVIGWITIPDTTVNYPIVQAPAKDPSYYLRHDVYKNWTYIGVPYLDAECAEDGLMAQNAVIFAHHISHGEPMFAPITQYADRAYADEHSKVLIQTPTDKRVLYVQGAARIHGNDKTKRCTFTSAQDQATWYQDRLNECIWHTDNLPATRTTTLITCSYNSKNERTALYLAADSDIPNPVLIEEATRSV